MNPKNEFIELFKEHIHREGAEKLLEYLQSDKSDFFTAPASTRFHGDYEMGVNVKMKMYKNADSKCTILAKHSEIEYNLSGSDESELQKRHLREGEIYAERKSGGKY